MIPTINDGLEEQFELVEQPSRTFRLHTDKDRVMNYTDELEAVKQAIYLILSVERYEHLIYSWDYGIELADLFGKPIPYVLPELKRRITEALTQDERIQSVDAFSFESSKGKVHARFVAHTIYGEVEGEKEVDV